MNRLLVAAAASAAGLAMALLQGFAPPPAEADLVAVDAGTVAYRAPGEFLRGGIPENGPLATLAVDVPFDIMRAQVTRGAFARCVAARACKPLDGDGDPALPATGLSWHDAVAYAAWLSRETGAVWRPPTDAEWALAAGSRYRDDAPPLAGDPANPAARWLAVYEAETAREAVDPTVRPVGAFGPNERGLLDLAGNVWEWTSTCYARHQIDPVTGVATAHENCTIRVAEGRHRALMAIFFRDPKAGACAVGVPPAHLGLRLVRERPPGLVARLRTALGV